MSERFAVNRTMAALPVRAVYRLAELAQAAQISRWRMLQLLRREGVEIRRSGHVFVVSLAELETKFWPFWEGIKAAEALRRSVEDG